MSKRTASGTWVIVLIKDLDVAATGEEVREERKETVVFLGFFRDAGWGSVTLSQVPEMRLVPTNRSIT